MCLTLWRRIFGPFSEITKWLELKNHLENMILKAVLLFNLYLMVYFKA